MKKLLLIGIMIIFGLQTFSFSPRNSANNNPYKLPATLNAMTLQDFLALTPKKYMELTGKRMSLKQKITFAILKARLKKQLSGDNPKTRNPDIGLLSLIFGGSAVVVAIVSALIAFVGGLISIPLAILAIIYGIIGLRRKKGDTKSIIGLVLGSVFIIIAGVVVILALRIS